MATRQKRGVVESLTDPSKSILFFLVFGVYGLTLASDSLSKLVLDALGPWLETRYGIDRNLSYTILWLGITVLLLILVLVFDLADWLTRRLTPQTLKPEPLMATYPGLIVIMSRPGKAELTKTAAAEAIQHHWSAGKGNLQHCWILCGGETITEQARQMIKQLIGGRIEQERGSELTLTAPENSNRKLAVSFRQISTSNTDDPNAIFDLINAIYREADDQDLRPEQIIADYTGGTKSMTAGMVLASAEVDRQLQFMRPQKYQDDGRVDYSVPSVATQVEVRFKLSPIRRKQ